jgi:hypothetical protein
LSVTPGPARAPESRSFLVLFFKKEPLPSPVPSAPILIRPVESKPTVDQLEAMTAARINDRDDTRHPMTRGLPYAA